MGSPIRAVATAVFWSAGATITATYLAFPLLLLARGRLVRRPVAAADLTVDVTVVIAAFNEEKSLGAKLENLLAADWPRERLQVVVASDGSTDRTNEVAGAFVDRGVRLLALPRVGKAAALNAALAEATGEIVIFSDANSMFSRDAIREIVRPFADPQVGGVAGDQRYDRGGASGAMAEGERGYWDLDRMLKRAESASGNVISATGAIYAVRRSLVPPVADGVTDDFFTSTAVVAAGRRLVFAERAAAFEPVAASGGVEYGRKVRVMTRGLRGVVLRRALLDPRRTGFYAIQMFWHKLLRRLMVFPLMGLAVSSSLLVTSGRLYRLAAAGQAAFYGVALVGVATRGRAMPRPVRRLLALPAYFCVVNVAALHAAWNVVRGHRIDRWEPQRASAASPEAQSAALAPADLPGSGAPPGPSDSVAGGQPAGIADRSDASGVRAAATGRPRARATASRP